MTPEQLKEALRKSEDMTSNVTHEERAAARREVMLEFFDVAKRIAKALEQIAGNTKP